jgi:plasmid stabilization system protein ParE
MFTVKLLTKAEIEVTDACKWYEDQQPGLAKKFLNEVNHYLALIAANPFFSNQVFRQVSFCCVKSIPILYCFQNEEDKELIDVISVFHTSRNPVNF